MAVATVTAVAVVPSEKVAVNLRVTPMANSIPAKSAAKSWKLPPSGTANLTAIVAGSLRSAPSRAVAAPSTQAGVAASVSQVPGALLCNRRRVVVRPPGARSVAVRVPSSDPSPPSARLAGPTRSRSMPVYMTVSDGASGGGGSGGSDAVAVTARESVSSSAVKLIFPVKPAAAVGEKRTVTSRAAPGATVKEGPETIVNGAEPATVTDRSLFPTFVTVKTRSTAVPTEVEPKSIRLGVTVKSVRAAPVASGEQSLSNPA